MPGRATDGLRPVVDETSGALEERAIEALALGGVLEPPELIAQPPEHGREPRAEVGIGAERAGDGPCLEGRDAHLVLLAKAARMRLLAAQVLRVSEEPLELLEEGSAYPVELPERGLLRTSPASSVMPPHTAQYLLLRKPAGATISPGVELPPPRIFLASGPAAARRSAPTPEVSTDAQYTAPRRARLQDG